MPTEADVFAYKVSLNEAMDSPAYSFLPFPFRFGRDCSLPARMHDCQEEKGGNVATG